MPNAPSQFRVSMIKSIYQIQTNNNLRILFIATQVDLASSCPELPEVVSDTLNHTWC